MTAQEPQAAPGSHHIGRSWDGHAIEDECPCPKAPCGLVVQETASEECDQHPLSAGRTIRQGHPAGQCPGRPQPAPAKVLEADDPDERADVLRMRREMAREAGDDSSVEEP